MGILDLFYSGFCGNAGKVFQSHINIFEPKKLHLFKSELDMLLSSLFNTYVSMTITLKRATTLAVIIQKLSNMDVVMAV